MWYEPSTREILLDGQRTEEGVFLQSMERRGSDLETYFLDLIGGGHHA